MMKSIYVGLPVKDLTASTQFYEALGFTKNAQFSDDTTSTMVNRTEIAGDSRA